MTRAAQQPVQELRWSESQANEIVRGAFIALFGREPDEGGRRFYVDHLLHGRLTIETFLRQLTESPEFSEKCLSLGFGPDLDAPVRECLADPAVRDLSARIAAHDAESLRRFELLVASARLPVDEVPGQEVYVRDHLVRFHELAHAARILVGGIDRPRVLEFGPSAFSALYRRILPGCRLVLADRPADGEHRGFDAALCDRIAQPDGFVAVDLVGPLDRAAEALDRYGPFDLIVFTEVLEHLARHPAEVLGFLIGRLAPDGFLYLTTPNALSRGNLHLIGRRRNPQQLFPRQDANWDAHHHVREYTMTELIESVAEAGGRVRALHFSSCWDEPEHADHLAAHPDQRGNLVVVASPSRP